MRSLSLPSPFFFLALALFLFIGRPTEAAFSPFQSLGTPVVLPEISCVADQPGKAVCAARNLRSYLAVNRYDGSVWTGWTVITGILSSAPSCAAVGGGKVICVSRAYTGAFTAVVYDGTTWSAPTLLGGSITSGPSCDSYQVGSVVCAGRSNTGGLTWITTDGTTASEPKLIGGTTIFSPKCASDNAAATTKNVICTSTNVDGHLLAQRFNGTNFTAAIDLGGLTTSNTTCTNLGTGVVGKLLCMVKSANAQEFVNQFAGGAFKVSGWSGFSSVAGGATYDASCAPTAANTVVCGVIGNVNSSLYYDVYSGGSFNGFEPIGGTANGSPSCFALEAGKVMCVIPNVNGTASSTVGP